LVDQKVSYQGLKAVGIEKLVTGSLYRELHNK